MACRRNPSEAGGMSALMEILALSGPPARLHTRGAEDLIQLRQSGQPLVLFPERAARENRGPVG